MAAKTPTKKSSPLKKLLGWINLTTMATFITAVVTFSMAWWNIKTTGEVREKEKRLDWQKTVVFTIIEKGHLEDNKGQRGLTFNEIKERYQKTVGDQLNIYKQYNLSKEDLDDTTLHRLLLELIAYGHIRQHSGKMYTVVLDVFNPRFDRAQNETDIKYEIINVLTIEKGQHTAEELRIRIKFSHDIEGYNYVINRLFAERMIIATQDNVNKSRKVLWTSANCPHCPLTSEPPTVTPLKDAPAPPPAPEKKGSQCCGQMQNSD